MIQAKSTGLWLRYGLGTALLTLGLLAPSALWAQDATQPATREAATNVAATSTAATMATTHIIAASQPTVATPASQPTTLGYGKPITTKIVAGKFITYPVEQQQVRAYWVTPQGRGPWPAVIVVHDIFGMTDWIKKQADELAGQGYAVIVPDLYTRQGIADGIANAGEAWICYEKMSDPQAMGDLRAAVGYLAKSETVGENQPIGVVGYDMGGIYAMMLASIDLRVKVAVNYYGRLIYPEITARRPNSPVEMLTNLRAPLLSFYGVIDPQIPADHLKRLEGRLANNPSRTYYEIVKYPNVGHGFLVPTRQGYNAQAAADAKARTRDFLAKVLRAEPPKAEE